MLNEIGGGSGWRRNLERQIKLGLPPWLWSVSDCGRYPYEVTEVDLKEEIAFLKEHKAAIENRIVEVERMLRQKEGKH
jgi:hypothetical protein